MIQKYFKLFESTRSVELTNEEFIKIIKDKCGDFLKNPFLIQRNKDDFQYKPVTYSYIDPKKHYRKQLRSHVGVVSEHGSLFMDNLKSWSGYPKRSISVIGTTNASTSYEFGYCIFFLIPYDGAKFGVAPSGDIWSAGNEYNVKFNDTFSFDLSDDNISDEGFESMIEDIYKCYKEQIGDLSYATNKLVSMLEENGCDNLESAKEILSKELSPDKLVHNGNSFELMNYNQITNVVGNREIWTDSECLLFYITKIDVKAFSGVDKVKQEIRNLFSEFIKTLT